jgi:AcrR family transcriptional regulator
MTVSDEVIPRRRARVRKRQERSLVTQRKLLRAAIEAFAETGFKGTSTRDIARRAGVHHPLITYHFRNKEQLWIAATDSVFREFGETLAGVLDPARTQRPEARMRSLIHNFVLFAQREPALHKIILQEAASPGPRLAWLVDTHLKPMVDATESLVAELQELGAMPQGNPKLIFSMLRATVGGLLALGAELERSSDMDIDADDTLDEITDAIERVFLPGAVPSQE